MRTILAANLTPGDTIHEDKKTVEVKRLSRGESCNGMHVNDTLCYDRAMTVRVNR